MKRGRTGKNSNGKTTVTPPPIVVMGVATSTHLRPTRCGNSDERKGTKMSHEKKRDLNDLWVLMDQVVQNLNIFNQNMIELDKRTETLKNMIEESDDHMGDHCDLIKVIPEIISAIGGMADKLDELGGDSTWDRPSFN